MEINNLNLGGMSISAYQGSDNSAYLIENVDLHSEPGVFKCQQAMKAESTSTMNAAIAIIQLQDNNTLFFEKNRSSGDPKVWKRTSAGSYSEYTTVASANTVYDAILFDNYIYYSYSTAGSNFYVGRMRASGSVSKDDTWYQVNVTSTDVFEDMPFAIVGGSLFWGVTNKISRFDNYRRKGTGQVTQSGTTITGTATVFTEEVYAGDFITYGAYSGVAVTVTDDTHLTMDSSNSDATPGDFQIITETVAENSLILETNDKVQKLTDWQDRLLIGTKSYGSSSSYSLTGFSKLILWDTVSEGWAYSDTLSEFGINSFIKIDNGLLISAGYKGNIYSYQNYVAMPFRRLPCDITPGKKCFVHAGVNWGGQTLLGVSNNNDLSIGRAVYNLGRYAPGMNSVLTKEYQLSIGDNFSTFNITAMKLIEETLLVAYGSFGANDQGEVDTIDLANKATGTIESRLINSSRVQDKIYKIEVPYKEMQSGTSIQLYVSLNNGSYNELTLKHDAVRNLYYTDVSVQRCNTMQVKLVMNPNTNYTPVIEAIIITKKNA